MNVIVSAACPGEYNVEEEEYYEEAKALVDKYINGNEEDKKDVLSDICAALSDADKVVYDW